MVTCALFFAAASAFGEPDASPSPTPTPTPTATPNPADRTAALLQLISGLPSEELASRSATATDPTERAIIAAELARRGREASVEARRQQRRQEQQQQNQPQQNQQNQQQQPQQQQQQVQQQQQPQQQQAAASGGSGGSSGGSGGGMGGGTGGSSSGGGYAMTGKLAIAPPPATPTTPTGGTGTTSTETKKEVADSGTRPATRSAFVSPIASTNPVDIVARLRGLAPAPQGNGYATAQVNNASGAGSAMLGGAAPGRALVASGRGRTLKNIQAPTAKKPLGVSGGNERAGESIDTGSAERGLSEYGPGHRGE